MLRLCDGCGAEKAGQEFQYDKRYSDRFSRYCQICRALICENRDVDEVKPWTDTPFILHIDAYRNMKNTPSRDGYIFFIKQSTAPYIFIDHTHELPNTLNSIRRYFFDDLILLLAIPGTRQYLDKINAMFKQNHLHGNWYSYRDELSAWIMGKKGLKNSVVFQNNRLSRVQSSGCV